MFKTSECAFSQEDGGSTLGTQMWSQSWAKAQTWARAPAFGRGLRNRAVPGFSTAPFLSQVHCTLGSFHIFLRDTLQLQGQQGTDVDYGNHFPDSALMSAFWKFCLPREEPTCF